MFILFISGIPATGKTTLGNYLQENFNFTHLDLTDLEKSLIEPDEIRELQNKLDTYQEGEKNVVITWGFGPQIQSHKEIVKLILDRGAKMIWLDGNHAAARDSFLKRGGMPEDSFNQQMDQVNNTGILKEYNPIIINVFDSNEKFKGLKKISEEILQATSS